MKSKRLSLTRREFIRACAAVSVTAPAAALAKSRGRSLPAHDGPKIPLRRLGRTEAMVSMLGMGGGEWLSRTEDREEAARIVTAAIESGITYFDTAHGYGRSQTNLGTVMGTPLRKGVFIASKVDDRSYDGAMRQFEENLKQLRVDMIDLLQVHYLKQDDINGLDRPDGVIAAMRKLREQKAVRFLGVTGHPYQAAVKAVLERHDDFDTMMCFVNPTTRSIPTFAEHLPILLKKDMGVVAMKVFGGGDPAGLIGDGPGKTSARELLRFALSEPVSVAIPAVSSMKQLQDNVDIARTFEPMSAVEREALAERLKE